MISLVLIARAAIGQTPAEPSGPPKITYENGQLRIDALGSTLEEVLTRVAALTGAKIDMPPGASTERMPIVELGPGPARQVLALLLNDSSFDYLIQASDRDPQKIQKVLVIPREKKGSLTNLADARGPRGPKPEVPAPDNPPPAQPENTAAAADVNASNPIPAPVPPADQFTPQPDQSNPLPLGQPGQTNVPKVFPVAPPPAMTEPLINNQLQQMYQQRIQMQQLPPTATTPSNPGGR